MALEENLRFRVSVELKSAWTELCDRKKISQQDAINALIEWFLKQDSLVQALVFGQIEKGDVPDVMRLVVARLKQTGSASQGQYAPRLAASKRDEPGGQKRKD